MGALRVGHIEIFTRDVARAREFYEHVLGATIGEVQHGGKVVWLFFGATQLLLRQGSPPRAPGAYARAAVGFVLYCDGLNATAAALRKRGLEFAGTDGSPRCLTFQDPDGNWFQLVDPKEQ